MTSPAALLASNTIAALHANHDELAALVPNLSDAQLNGPSGASEWTVAQVLSHLGSGAEISLAGYQTFLSGAPEPEADFNQTVWDRWNALSPQEQADGFVEHNAKLVTALDALTPEQRATLEIKPAFLPFPLPIGTLLGMRLNEAAQHEWDVRVAIDPAAGLSEQSTAVLSEHLSGGLSFLLGFTGKAEALAHPAVVDIAGTGLAIVIGDQVSLAPTGSEATATFRGPLEAVIRLIGGRLTPKYTPATVTVTGNVSLDDLRRVFPGF